MRIQISDAILADPTQWPNLESVLDHARRGRCYVDTVNPDASKGNAWLAQTNASRQADWHNAIEWSIMDSAQSRLRTLVADVVADPGATPDPKITLEDAIRLVGFPSVLWVENRRNDRLFFLSMMRSEQRAMFEELERRVVFEFRSCGGLGELRKTLEDLSGRAQLDPRTNRAFFDSDGEVPGHRSRDAQLMIDFCVKSHIAHHCLYRRAIENYIPLHVLKEWANDGGTHAAERKRRVRAFSKMSDVQRYHFRMKSGWDASPTPQVAALFADVSGGQRSILNDGIDVDVAVVYDIYMDMVYEWAFNEGIDPGVQAAIDEITHWIRVPYA